MKGLMPARYPLARLHRRPASTCISPSAVRLSSKPLPNFMCRMTRLERGKKSTVRLSACGRWMKKEVSTCRIVEMAICMHGSPVMRVGTLIFVPYLF